MSSYNALIVVLEGDLHESQVEPIVAAIRQMRGVADVEKNEAGDMNLILAESRARHELREKFVELLWPKKEK